MDLAILRSLPGNFIMQKDAEQRTRAILFQANMQMGNQSGPTTFPEKPRNFYGHSKGILQRFEAWTLLCMSEGAEREGSTQELIR